MSESSQLSKARKALRQALEAQASQTDVVQALCAKDGQEGAIASAFTVLEYVSLTVRMLGRAAQLDEMSGALLVTSGELRRWFEDCAPGAVLSRLADRQRKVLERLDHLERSTCHL